MGEFELSDDIEPVVPNSLPGKRQITAPEQIEEGMSLTILYDPIRTSLRKYRTGTVRETYSEGERDVILMEDNHNRVTLIKSYIHEGVVTGYDVYSKSDGEIDCIGELLAFYSR